MNVKQMMIAMVVLTTAGSAFAAGDVDPFPAQKPFVSTKTRTEVQAELAQVRAQGVIGQGEDPNYPALPPVRSTRSRDEVRAEAIEAVKHHKFNPDYDVN